MIKGKVSKLYGCTKMVEEKIQNQGPVFFKSSAERMTGKTTATALSYIAAAMCSPGVTVIMSGIKKAKEDKEVIEKVKSLLERLELEHFSIFNDGTHTVLEYNILADVAYDEETGKAYVADIEW